MKCIVCNEYLDPKEITDLALEFQSFPAHEECFDEFDNADAFLKFAKSATESQKNLPESSPEAEL